MMNGVHKQIFSSRDLFFFREIRHSSILSIIIDVMTLWQAFNNASF